MLTKSLTTKQKFIMARMLEVPEFIKPGLKFTSEYITGVREILSVDESAQELLTMVRPKPKQELRQGQPMESFEPYKETMSLRLVIAGFTSGEYYEPIGEIIEDWEDEALRSVTYGDTQK